MSFSSSSFGTILVAVLLLACVCAPVSAMVVRDGKPGLDRMPARAEDVARWEAHYAQLLAAHQEQTEGIVVPPPVGSFGTNPNGPSTNPTSPPNAGAAPQPDDGSQLIFGEAPAPPPGSTHPIVPGQEAKEDNDVDINPHAFEHGTDQNGLQDALSVNDLRKAKMLKNAIPIPPKWPTTTTTTRAPTTTTTTKAPTTTTTTTTTKAPTTTTTTTKAPTTTTTTAAPTTTTTTKAPTTTTTAAPTTTTTTAAPTTTTTAAPTTTTTTTTTTTHAPTTTTTTTSTTTTKAPTTTTAAPSSSFSTSSGIAYNGGLVLLGTPTVYIIWYGNWAGNTATTLIPEFLQNLDNSDYYKIQTSYGSKINNVVSMMSGRLAFGGAVYDSYSQGTTISNSVMPTIVAAQISAGKLPRNSNGIYMVLTSADVKEDQFCVNYCGYHSYAYVSGTYVQYAFVGNGDGCPNYWTCKAQQVSPNGNAGADGMMSVIAHEIVEAATDPRLNSWYFTSGNENADQCAWTFGTSYTTSNGAKANMKLANGKDYYIQRNWVNLAEGYCSLSLVHP